MRLRFASLLLVFCAALGLAAPAGAQIYLAGVFPNAIPAGSNDTAFTVGIHYASTNYSFCFYTGFGTSTPHPSTFVPLNPQTTGYRFTVPAAEIDDIPVNAFASGSYLAKVYPVATTATSCPAPAAGTFESVTIGLPTITGLSLPSAPDGNPQLSTALPRSLILTGTNFTPQTGNGYGSRVTTGGGTGSYPVFLSSTELRYPLPLGLSGPSLSLSVCNAPGGVGVGTYCTNASTLPLTSLAANPGTVTASPNPSLTTRNVTLTANFGPATASVAGAPSGLVTFTDGANTSTAPLHLDTSATLVAAATTSFRSRDNDLTHIRAITADFNQDGIPDLLFTDAGDSQRSNAPVLHMLLGSTPLGTVAGDQSYSFPAGTSCGTLQSVAVADYNGDGFPDVAVLCLNGGGPETVYTLLNNGDGTLSATPISYPGSVYGSFMAAGDFNKDGRQDLVVAGNTAAGAGGGFQVLAGNGTGAFTAGALSTGYNVQENPGFGDYQVLAADLNNDGAADVVVMNGCGVNGANCTQDIQVFQNDGTGQFLLPSIVATDGTNYNHIDLLPLVVGSAYPDLIVTSYSGSQAAQLSVHRNLAGITAGFGAGTVTPVANLADTLFADFNGDGLVDAVVFDGTTAQILTGDGQHFTSVYTAETLNLPNSTLAKAVDLNGDGYADLLTYTIQPGEGSNGFTVHPYLSAGTATASTAPATFAGGTHTIVASTPGTYTLAPGSAQTTLLILLPTPTVVLSATPAATEPYGTSITLSAQVNGPAASGNVQFFDNGALLATVPLSAGTTTSTASYAFTPNAGPQMYTAMYSGSATYNPGSSNTVTQSIIAIAPTFSFAPNPATIPYGSRLSAAQLDASATGFNGAPVNGSFSYAPGVGALLPAGRTVVQATFTSNDSNYTGGSTSAAITVTQATPTILWQTPAPIAQGTALSGTQLNAQATDAARNPVAGTYVYNPPAGTVLPAGSTTLNVAFTPSDAADYTSAAGSVVQVVNSATTTTSLLVAPSPAEFGTPINLTATTVLAGTSTAAPGTTSFFDNGNMLGSSTSSPATLQVSSFLAGQHMITAVYAANASYAGSISPGFALTITPATTTVSWNPAPTSIVYGTPLANTQLNASASSAHNPGVAGSFVYNPPLGTTLAAGNQTLNVAFTPADATDYKAAIGTAGITVTRATPRIAWTTPAGVTAGTALSGAQLNAQAFGYNGQPLPGSFAYTPALGTVLTAVGTTTLNAVFTPTDAADYTTAPASVQIAVTPARTTLSLVSSSNPAAYNQPFTLTATVSGPLPTAPSGSVTFYNNGLAAGTVPLIGGVAVLTPATLPAGTYLFTASYLGDTQNAGSTSTTGVSQVISSANSMLSWTPAVSSIVYGTPLSAAQLNATSTVPGTFTYNPPAGTVLAAGTQLLSATFTPADQTNYKPATITASITVTPATPVLSWATPAPVSAGSALTSAQLNATAAGYNGSALAGTFVYNPPLNTPVAAGTLKLNVTFTPADTLDYTSAAASVQLTVVPLTLASLSSTSANLGDPAKTITLTGTAFLPAAVAQVNGTAVATTFVSSTTLTAVVPASYFLKVQTLQVSVVETSAALSTTALPLLVGASTAGVALTGPPTTTPGNQPTLTLQPAAYPVDVTVTLTLSFTPSGTLPDDPAIQFATGGRTYSFVVPANTTAPVSVLIASGTVAGTIRVTTQLMAGGSNVTPATLAPLVIQAPAAVPGLTSATLSVQNTVLTVTLRGFSNTRELTGAHFHFTPAAGSSLSTSELDLDVTAIFAAWFSDPNSPQYGSTFTYNQTFNLNANAAAVGGVTVTLINSVGASAGASTP